jgi:hypothetical protein
MHRVLWFDARLILPVSNVYRIGLSSFEMVLRRLGRNDLDGYASGKELQNVPA